MGGGNVKTDYLISFAALILGGLLGPTALVSAQAANPPIQWTALPVIFLGTAFSMVLVLGLPIIGRKRQWARSGIRFFVPASLFVVGASIVAVFADLLNSGSTPATFFFLVIACGMLVGLGVSSIVFRLRFKQASVSTLVK